MIQITQISLKIFHTKEELENKIRKLLNLKPGEPFTYEIVKKSIDGRKKPDLFVVYSLKVTCENEDMIIKKSRNANVTKAKNIQYIIPDSGKEKMNQKPIVIGAGPAGLFAAYLLAESGFSPIVLERGKQVEQRTEDVLHFWNTNILDPHSNVQFGEGGAGTFSDGKLNTVVKDPSGRNRFVLETLVRFGAPGQILYENKPHIGTDILCDVIKNMRLYMQEKGASFYFQTCVTDFVIENNRIKGVICNHTKQIDSNHVILAIGHSARDTFDVLLHKNIPMEAKNFAVGLRVEHPQKMIDEAMYGMSADSLPAAPYKVTSNFPNGRGVYSFCMCPGGYVVNASSEEKRLVVNGMSYSGRNSSTANSAIIVSVNTGDFGADDPLAGVRYQRLLEEKAYTLADGKIPQQLYGDYCMKQKSADYGSFASNTKGMAAFANLRGLFSQEIEYSFMEGMRHFGHIIKGFDRNDAILSGVESRTSSPLRILRNENYESLIEGLYPCGEGAGYAGGITSAAMDGMKVAETIIKKYRS